MNNNPNFNPGTSFTISGSPRLQTETPKKSKDYFQFLYVSSNGFIKRSVSMNLVFQAYHTFERHVYFLVLN